MRQIQEILRLKYQNQLSVREIARSCGLPTSTVGDYLKRAEAAGISWPLPQGQSEKELLQLLIAQPVAGTAGCQALPEWPYIHKELGRKSVTLRLLWQEYRQAQPEGYGYSRFCELYQRWAGTLDPVLRQVHLPGEKMFVDWAGQTVPIYNAQDGSVSAGHLFVAVLGASNKTFAEAFENEQLASLVAFSNEAYNYYLAQPATAKRPRQVLLQLLLRANRLQAGFVLLHLVSPPPLAAPMHRCLVLCFPYTAIIAFCCIVHFC